jgi:hypothetical protein
MKEDKDWKEYRKIQEDRKYAVRRVALYAFVGLLVLLALIGVGLFVR